MNIVPFGDVEKDRFDLSKKYKLIEMMPEYMEIAKARIDGVRENKQLEQLKLLKQ